MEMTEALKKALPDKITETVALSIAVKTGNDYERNQHERLSAKLGFGQEWVRSVEKLDPENQDLMTEAERVAQTFALAAMERMGRQCDKEFERLLDILEVPEAVSVLMLVGRYITHAIAVNTLGLIPPKPSIFEENT
jgi:hypothetical protein